MTGEKERYASFWRRVGATLIDTLLYVALITPVLFFLGGHELWARATGFHPDDPLSLGLNDLIPFILAVAFWMYSGATPGKSLLHCTVVDLRSGGKLSLRQSVVRYLGYIVSTLPLGLGFLWILWDKRRQGFHDKLAGTVVLYRPEDESAKSINDLMRESE